MGVATEEDVKLQKLAILISTEKQERIHDVTQLQSFEVRINERVYTFRENLKTLDTVVTDLQTQLLSLRKYEQYAESLAKQDYKNMLQINRTRNFI